MTKPLISPEYAELNKQLHLDQSDYGSDSREAAHDAAVLVDNVRRTGGTVLLDFGCGKGQLKPAIAKIAPDITVLEFDPAVEGKDVLPTESVDVVAAMDVMEHIEAEYLDAVLDTIQGLNPKMAIMKIALTPAKKVLADGRNAHILLRPAAWWFEQLQRYFTPLVAQESPLYCIFIGAPLPPR